MGHDDQKKYFEDLAKEVLSSFVDSKFSLLQLCDKPDLQSIELKYGIEVTRCMRKEDGIFDFFIREYEEKPNLKIDLNQKIKELKLDCVLWPDFHAVLRYKKDIDMSDERNLIKQKIYEKSKKASKYSCVFPTMGLYLFSKWSFNNNSIQDILKDIDNIKFDKLFIDCKNRIYIYTVSNKKIEEISFNMDVYKKILNNLNQKYNIN